MRLSIFASAVWVACSSDVPLPSAPTSAMLVGGARCGSMANAAIADGNVVFTDLQDAFDQAVATVRICPGTYAGPFVIPTSLHVGSETGAVDTVLDGGGLGTTLTVDASPLILHGVTITGGLGIEGGGVHLSVGGGQTTIGNSTVTGNTAETGGGIWSADGASLNLTGTTVSGCIADDEGGGVYAEHIRMVGGAITGNAAESGGGVRMTTDSRIEGTAIEDNSADFLGGGLLVDGSFEPGSTATLVDTLVRRNDALGSCAISSYFYPDQLGGGGVYVMAQYAELRLRGTTRIADNSAPNGCGGGVFAAHGVFVRGGDFHGNSALFGGGLMLNRGADASDAWIHGNSAAAGGGGISIFEMFRIARMIVENNTSDGDGGGVFHVLPSPYGGGPKLVVNESEFRGNVAAGVGGGLALVNDDTDVFVRDSIIEDNHASFGGGLAARTLGDGTGSFQFTPGAFDVRRTTIVRNVATVEGGGAYVGGTLFGGDLESINSDWGDVADDNVPNDVTVDDLITTTSYVGYIANEAFVCDEVACIPGP